MTTAKTRVSLEPAGNIFILPALLMVLVYFLHGFNDDTIDDSYRIVFMKGLTTAEPFNDWFVYLIFLSDIFVWLYKKIPGIPWYGITFLFFFFLALVNCFYIIRNIFVQLGIKPWLTSIFLILFFYLFWAESLILFTMTKVAMLTNLSIIGSYLLLKNQGWTKTVIALLFFNGVVFSFGLLARYEMVWIVLPVLLLLFLLMPLRKGITVTVMIPSIVFCTALFFYLHFAPSNDQEYFNRAEPYIFTLLDASGGASLADQKSLVDSVKFVSVQNWFFTDRPQFDLAFFSKVSHPSFINWKALINRNADAVNRIFALKNELFYRSLPAMIFNGLLLLACLGFFTRNLFSIPTLLFISYHLFFWLYVLTTTILIKMEFRVLDPMLVIYTCGSFLLFFSLYRNENLKPIVLTMVIAGLALLPREYTYNRDLARYEQQEISLVNHVWSEADSLFRKKILVPDIDANLQLSLSSPFVENKLTKHNKIIPFDSGYSTFHTSFREEMKKLTGSDSFGDFYKYLFTNRDEVVFISTPERLLLVQVYLKTIYGEIYCFKMLNTGTALAPLKDYGLRKEFHYYVFVESGSCEVNEREIFNQKVAS